MPGFAQAQRRALADLFIEKGPSAPTLCEGWNASDLAAHIVIRERRPDAAVGILAAPLAAYSERVRRSTRDTNSWTDLVAQVRNGPPAPLRPIDDAINTVEFYVHHQDLRRAGDATAWPEEDPALQEALWRHLRSMSRILFRRSPVGVTLDAGSYGLASAKGGPATVTLRGMPSELLLFGFGRTRVAKVDLDGDDVSVERLRQTRLGL